MAVSAAFGGVHGVGGENGMEHVGAVDLGAGICCKYDVMWLNSMEGRDCLTEVGAMEGTKRGIHT